MKREDIVIKETKQGIVVSLDSSLDFEELLGRLRVRLNESKLEDLNSEGQVIVDLGNRDVSKIKLSVLESLFFEHGLFLKRIMSRPDLPKTATRTTAKTKSSASDKEKKGKKGQIKTKSKTKAENLAIEDAPISNKSKISDKSVILEEKDVASAEVASAIDLIEKAELSPKDSTITVKKTKNNSRNKESTIASNGEVELKEIFKRSSDQTDTLLIEKSLRSGQSIQYPGNVVIMGDVNPGAEVIASGNIVVLGNFRGVAHAGAFGDESATVTAFRLQPIQLRIAGHITRPPDGEEATVPEVPEIARIRDGVMVIERY